MTDKPKRTSEEMLAYLNRRIAFWSMSESMTDEPIRREKCGLFLLSLRSTREYLLGGAEVPEPGAHDPDKWKQMVGRSQQKWIPVSTEGTGPGVKT